MTRLIRAKICDPTLADVDAVSSSWRGKNLQKSGERATFGPQKRPPMQRQRAGRGDRPGGARRQGKGRAKAAQPDDDGPVGAGGQVSPAGTMRPCVVALPDVAQPTSDMTPNPKDASLPWIRQFVLRARHDFLLKSIGTTVFMTIFFVAYIHLLKHPAFPVTVMPLIGLDDWIAFDPHSLPLYLSLWLYTSLPPALIVGRRELIGYGIAIALVCLFGLGCFYFLPTAVPVPTIDWAAYPGFDFLHRIDSAGNACPSLHVAAAVFSALWLHRLLIEMDSRRWLLALNALWCVGILYSTLATKQHVALDLFAGLALGLVGAWASLRWLKPRS
jgi:membrane-associated phospholipid phosphatase